ncbi:MAG TPA: MBL fold metallo-hydrolase [Bryobacteraceae bacterium]|jgi:L-ascorbate metabolism protein UlaG (beta-lactamase superfamily)|nr:MBL fold metallo-hydrolase [Bryobacteraceae bacterium]
MRAPETARFLRHAGPAFFRHISGDRRREISPAPHRPDLKAWRKEGLHAAWLGHSTVLLMLDGFTILTDPVFSERIGLRLGRLVIGMKRLVEVAAPRTELPPVDVVLLSHAHMDHFDLPSLRQLEDSRTRVVTADQTCDLLRRRRYAQVHELRWNQSVQVGPARFTAFEVQHWGARMRNDMYRGYNGYLVEVGRHRVVFGGDTAYTDSFKRLRSSQPIDMAIMPVGAYDPWIRVHCNPEQALTMANHAGAEFVLPVHHQTFTLSREPRFEPIERIVSAAGPHAERICVREIGDEFHL